MSPLDHAEDLAKKLRGNWRKFDSFGWHDKPEDPEDWCIVYTHNRDSSILEESNAAQIEKIMSEFPEEQCRAESHNHWACGWVDGYAIRVTMPDGSISPAFLAWSELQASLEDYPVLNDDDFCERETNAANEAWSNMRIEDRILLLQRHGTPRYPGGPSDWAWILQARHDYPPRDDNGYIQEYLLGH